jgi:hypothetical protein
VEKQNKKFWKIALLISTVSWLGSFQYVLAATNSNELMGRGEATDQVVKFFDLEKQNSKFLQQCKVNPDGCLFSFSTRTNFQDFRLDPVILYPDVYPAYKYYKSINVASELDLVRGYYDEENSPYKPEQKITKIEALKLILGASGLVTWKDKFEFSLDDKSRQEAQNWLTAGNWTGNQWWYGRYIFSAVSKGILLGTTFDVEAPISKTEFQGLLESTRRILADGQGDMSLVDKYGQADQEANTSTNLKF